MVAVPHTRVSSREARSSRRETGAKDITGYTTMTTKTATRGEMPEGYRPTDDEPFMNEHMKEYFRRILKNWRAEIVEETKGTVDNLKAESRAHPDAIDRAAARAGLR